MMTGVLEGFKPVGISAVSARRMPTPYNLRHSRRAHSEEFGPVGIAARDGSLLLYQLGD